MGTMVILGATSYESEPRSVRAARRYVRGLLAAQGVRSDDLGVVTSELVTNAITHGGGRIALVLLMDDSFIRVEVSDGGTGRPRIRPEDPDSEHGRGLPLVEGLSKRWGVSRTPVRTTVWAEVPRE